MQIETPEMTDTELIYVGDPMCSWCWGIAPAIDEIRRRRPELPLRIVVGGLRPGAAAEPMTDRMADFLEHHWRQVEARSGQPFDHSVLRRRDWTYDTETPCRAVVTIRELYPGREWEMFKRLQRAFYAEDMVVSDPSVYPELVRAMEGIDAEAFLATFASESAIKATWADFSLARSWGINGFPTVVVRTGEKGRLVASGYANADDLEMALEPIIGPAHRPAGDVCEPDTPC